MNKILGITLGAVIGLLLAVPLGSYVAEWVTGLSLAPRDEALVIAGIILAGVLLYAGYEHVVAKYDAEQDRKEREGKEAGENRELSLLRAKIELQERQRALASPEPSNPKGGA